MKDKKRFDKVRWIMEDCVDEWIGAPEAKEMERTILTIAADKNGVFAIHKGNSNTLVTVFELALDDYEDFHELHEVLNMASCRCLKRSLAKFLKRDMEVDSDED